MLQGSQGAKKTGTHVHEEKKGGGERHAVLPLCFLRVLTTSVFLLHNPHLVVKAEASPLDLDDPLLTVWRKNPGNPMMRQSEPLVRMPVHNTLTPFHNTHAYPVLHTYRQPKAHTRARHTVGSWPACIGRHLDGLTTRVIYARGFLTVRAKQPRPGETNSKLTGCRV